jgi:cyclin-dependent kinase regulatory subunit CKS1
MSNHQIVYSDKYYDDKFEFRHVSLPKDIASKVPSGRLLTEYEWRSFGIQMSRGCIHYGNHKPEPHILLFRREHGGENPKKEENVERQPLKQKNGQLHAPPKPTF